MQPMRVLLIEDDDSFAGALRAAMQSAHPLIDVDRCSTLEAAAVSLSREPYDAVLLDLDLSGCPGAQAIARVFESAPGIPLVALTPDDGEAGLSALQHGAQDYLVKGEVGGKYVARALRYAVERASIQAELVRREQHFRALIEQAYDIVVVLGQDGAFLYQSPAVQRVLGYMPEALDGTNVLDLVHPDDRERAVGVLGSSPLATGDDTLFHFRVRHQDGSWRVLETLGRWIERDPRKGIVVNARDVTERVRAEETLRATEAKLRQAHKMEAIGRLAGGIAHDFNNVLTAIYGYADLLLDAIEQDDPRRRDVEEIRQSAERAASLTRQLLAFSRQSMVQPQVLDLNVVVDEVQRMLSRVIGADIQLIFEPAAGLRRVRVDRGQIAQVLLNLGVNARDAMPEGGSLFIRTANRTVSPQAAEELPGLRAGDYVTLTVRDTGVGMSQEVQRHIFEPFFTTKETGAGTGLGLATVYGIVKQSGGGVYVESTEGKGTTFTIYLTPHQTTSSP
jgi:PAS domain S-box-containing protein